MISGKILLVDDQPTAAQASIDALTNFVSKDQILYASTAAQAIQILDSTPLAAAFLDIDMPDTKNFSLAKYIDQKHKGLPYVFLTGYANFAAESYDYEPLDFLTKPIDVVRLEKTFARLAQKKEEIPSGKIAIRSKNDYILVDPQEISYIFRNQRKSQINCLDGKTLFVSATIEELELIFEDYNFFRCHKSYLIPCGQIVQVRSGQYGRTYEAVLTDDSVIPISRNRYPALREKLERLGVRFL